VLTVAVLTIDALALGGHAAAAHSGRGRAFRERPRIPGEAEVGRETKMEGESPFHI
jgi:hypothetical protein